jgi:integrase
MITDASIKKAIKDALGGAGSVEIRDDGMRGEGRLVFIVRVKEKRITQEWYASWWREGRRKMRKIGVYPTLGVGEARRLFRERYMPSISAGGDPDGPRSRKSRRGVTIKDLFEAYVDDMKAKGKPSWLGVQRILLGPGAARDGGLAKSLGAGRRAADITAKDIREELVTIYERGAVAMAAETRAYVNAAFAYGLKSANSYTSSVGLVDWGLTHNPVSAIPSDPEARRAGDRVLKPAELRTFWTWLEGQDDRSLGAAVLRLEAATGQRLTEILCISDSSYDRAETMVDWSKTKNGLPHAIPLPKQAKAVLDGLIPNRHGLYFPHGDRPDESMTIEACEKLVRRFLLTAKIPHFTPRDLRRTWKTLAGAAGLSKEIRDRLQNHARQDVSSRHYDRWEMIPEKRAAMAQWSEYLNLILSGELEKAGLEGGRQPISLSEVRARRKQAEVTESPGAPEVMVRGAAEVEGAQGDLVFDVKRA